jgi:hypothetical protein
MHRVKGQMFFQATAIDNLGPLTILGLDGIRGAEQAQDLALGIGAGGMHRVLAINPVRFLLIAAPARAGFIGPAFNPAFPSPPAYTPAVSSTCSLASCHGTAYKAALLVMQLHTHGGVLSLGVVVKQHLCAFFAFLCIDLAV